MYKVISIENNEMTRKVGLKNLETGTVDECFDDSSLISNENFEFIKLSDEYDCKIKLFGNVVPDMQDETVLCKIVCRDMMIGTKNMIRVLVGNDDYYVPQKKVENGRNLDSFYFRYSRKDLIQVDKVVHADLL